MLMVVVVVVVVAVVVVVVVAVVVVVVSVGVFFQVQIDSSLPQLIFLLYPTYPPLSPFLNNMILKQNKTKQTNKKKNRFKAGVATIDDLVHMAKQRREAEMQLMKGFVLFYLKILCFIFLCFVVLCFVLFRFLWFN